MKNALTLIILFSCLICINAQENDNIGLYMRAAKEMINIMPSTVIDQKADISLFGWEKPCISMFIKEKLSKVYTKNRQPEFFFFFPNKSETTSTSMSKISQLIINYPFVYAKSPDDFTLIRLFKIKNERAYRLEKTKALSSRNDFNVLDIDTIPFTTIPISDTAYKIILDSELPIGEYGFILKEKTPYKEIVYDFSIETLK